MKMKKAVPGHKKSKVMPYELHLSSAKVNSTQP